MEHTSIEDVLYHSSVMMCNESLLVEWGKHHLPCEFHQYLYVFCEGTAGEGASEKLSSLGSLALKHHVTLLVPSCPSLLVLREHRSDHAISNRWKRWFFYKVSCWMSMSTGRTRSMTSSSACLLTCRSLFFVVICFVLEQVTNGYCLHVSKHLAGLGRSKTIQNTWTQHGATAGETLPSFPQDWSEWREPGNDEERIHRFCATCIAGVPFFSHNGSWDFGHDDDPRYIMKSIVNEKGSHEFLL